MPDSFNPADNLASRAAVSADNSFFSNLGTGLGSALGQSIGLAAQALPIWTASQLNKQMGNQLANPNYYYPASQARLSTPLYTTQPVLWQNSGQAGGSAYPITYDQYGQPVPVANTGFLQDLGGASMSVGQTAILIAAAIAAIVILSR